MNAPMPTRSVEETIEIDAPIEAVWKALNDAEELTDGSRSKRAWMNQHFPAASGAGA